MKTYILKPQNIASLEPSCKGVDWLKQWKRHNVCYQFVNSYNFITKGCKYVGKSQHDYFTKGLWICFNFFSLFHMSSFLNSYYEIFCNLLLKIHIFSAKDHIFCVNHCWININFSKCVNSTRFCISFWKFIIILNHTKIF